MKSVSLCALDILRILFSSMKLSFRIYSLESPAMRPEPVLRKQQGLRVRTELGNPSRSAPFGPVTLDKSLNELRSPKL